MATITESITQKESVPSQTNKLYPKITSVTISNEPDERNDTRAEIVSKTSLPDIPLPPPSTAPTDVLSLDKDTPDHHVPRDPRLIRLTGVHPFNTEAPLTALFNEGR
jgi:nitrate reductase (NAD(P)H)